MARTKDDFREAELAERERIMAWVRQKRLAFERAAAERFHLKLLGVPEDKPAGKIPPGRRYLWDR